METYIVFNTELQITKKVVGLEEAMKTKEQLTTVFDKEFTVEVEKDPWSLNFYR